MTEQTDSLVQAIIDRNRKEAKQAQDKAMALGAGIAIGGFQLAVGLGVLHFPPANGINVYRLVAAACCGVVGAAIGKWLGRPRSRK
jgi:hypothetical protein